MSSENVTELWSCHIMISVLHPSLHPPWLTISDSLCDLVFLLWKLGTPNYEGLSVIMYLTAEMYSRTVPPWKKRTANIN